MKWPFVEALVEQEKMAYIDWALADAIVDESEPLAALVCTLSKALRQGHICLYLSGDKITPEISHIWKEEGLTAKQLEQMHQLVKQGSTEKNRYLICKDNRFYFQKYFAMESELLEEIKKHRSTTPNQIATSLDENLVLPEQALAIQTALQSNLTLICGGPGTGKTYTAGWIIKRLFEQISDAQVALLAPTGKAAVNLQKSIRKFPELVGLTAKTLHAHLKGEERSYDAILVDECSMIDLKLMLRFFKSVKPRTRVIFLGDPSQLPPVEVGGVFSDLSQESCIRLNTCMRTDQKEIVNLAKAVNSGASDDVLKLLTEKSDVLKWEESFDRLWEHLSPFFDLGNVKEPLAILEHFNRFRLLSPMRKGPFGVDKLNEMIHQKVQSRYTPIMIAKNDYRLQLYNGEVGVLVEGKYAIFPDSTNEVRIVNAWLLPKYEYAYCLSVHKSQGSEFDHVFVLLPAGSEVFGREILYTAVTRAKNSIQIFGEGKVIRQTVENQSFRMSGFQK